MILSKSPYLVETTATVFFKVAKFESFEIIELGPFLEVPSLLVTLNVALSREQLAIHAR